MKKYKTIVIDPPWTVKSHLGTLTTTHGKYKDNLPYKMMSDKQISEFPINDFAAKDSILFLWTIHSKLELSFKILKHWNMKFHVLMSWYKHDGICMHGFCRDIEPCLVAYKGNLKNVTTNKHPLKLNIDSASTRHSEKPTKFYASLLKSTPAPRIDIFARRRHYGFDAYGDQVEPDTQTRIL